MPDLKAKIKAVVEGDALTIRRTIDRQGSGLASGATLTKAWLTIKSSFDDTDPSALVQKEITTTDQPGIGQIEDDGAGDVDPVVRFDLLAADTEAIVDAARVTAGLVTEKYYDIQVLTSAGGPYTGERGRIFTEPQVTDAQS